jgi:hypothetical protein
MSLSARLIRGLAAALLFLALAGCSSIKTSSSPAYSVVNNQRMLPVLPFSSTLVPQSFTEQVFNNAIDNLNDRRENTGFDWFVIIKENLDDVAKILPPGHIYLTGEIWSYIEESGCCSTELRVKSRLRIHRVGSRDLLWEAEIPMESFFEHDNSTLAVERRKLAVALAKTMSGAVQKALEGARRIQTE